MVHCLWLAAGKSALQRQDQHHILPEAKFKATSKKSFWQSGGSRYSGRDVNFRMARLYYDREDHRAVLQFIPDVDASISGSLGVWLSEGPFLLC